MSFANDCWVRTVNNRLELAEEEIKAVLDKINTAVALGKSEVFISDNLYWFETTIHQLKLKGFSVGKLQKDGNLGISWKPDFKWTYSPGE